MGMWRNRLAQESYTFKVAGSSPAIPTMKIEISDFYKELNLKMEIIPSSGNINFKRRL